MKNRWNKDNRLLTICMVLLMAFVMTVYSSRNNRECTGSIQRTQCI